MPVILHLCPFLSHLFDFARFVSLSLHLSYDPVHWGVPDGSYASDPDGPIRTLEFRSMVQVGCYRSMVQLGCCRSMVQLGSQWLQLLRQTHACILRLRRWHW